MTDKPHNESESSATPMNLGQAMLLATGASLATIVRDTGTAKTNAARWRKGTIPTASARKTLRAAYGIPFDAWDRVATPEALSRAAERARGRTGGKFCAREASGTPRNCAGSRGAPEGIAQLGKSVPDGSAGYLAPDLPDRPSDDAPPLEQIRFGYLCTMRDLTKPELTDATRSKLRNAAIRSLALIATLERGEELDMPRYVHEHPAFKRLMARVTTALEPFPEALRDVSAALQIETN